MRRSSPSPFGRSCLVCEYGLFEEKVISAIESLLIFAGSFPHFAKRVLFQPRADPRLIDVATRHWANGGAPMNAIHSIVVCHIRGVLVNN